MKTTRVDRRKDINTYKHWVYGLYLKGRLVYVGVTADPAGRLDGHLRTDKVFDEMRIVKGFSARIRADDFEKCAIIILQPEKNIAFMKTEYRPGGMAKREFQGFYEKNPTPFDFALIDNKSVQRRKRWEERKKV